MKARNIINRKTHPEKPPAAPKARLRLVPDPFARPGRYFVPDLSPEARPALRQSRPRVVFVAESPHVSEVAPEKLAERRPLCGRAGQQWWALLSELLEGEASADVSLERLEELCRRYRLAVLNAVQYPLDPKVAAAFPEARPDELIGFSKAPGPTHYRKMKGKPALRRALDSLKARLGSPELKGAPVYCLGNDAEWLVRQALGPDAFKRRVRGRLPHPSAWWRKGGLFGRVAREELGAILKTGG